jgi:uncharacterized protein YutE (UPF0331/DUF86 family)
MLRPEFVRRKLQLIADDLARLLRFKDETLASIVADDIKLAAVERLLERIVMRAIDINEHLLGELATGEEARSTRLTYRETFLGLAALSVYPPEFAEHIARSAGLRNILVHDYNDLDRKIVHQSIGACLQDYTRYIDYVDRFLQRSTPTSNP